MYPEEQGTDAGAPDAPVPHPAALCPSATSAAAGVLLPTVLVGVRPDAPARPVRRRPLRSAALAEIGLTGLRVAGAPFSGRGSRLGLALVEEAAGALQQGA